ncbi:MAG: hypothetical protein ABIJ34_01685 [archaeon]
MLFNMNEYVYVRLRKPGIKILKENDCPLPDEDEEGYFKFQLWDLFYIFGNHIYLGCDVPFETDIKIPE